MNSFVYLSIIGLLICNAYGRAIIEQENSIITADDDDVGFSGRQGQVSISKAPAPKIVQKIGTTVELECEASGSPPPRIQWVRGTEPIESIEELSSNKIAEGESSALVRVRSRLIIEYNALKERTYTCVGRSGSKTAYATTTIYPDPASNITDGYIYLSSLSGPKKTRIVLYYSVIFDKIGKNVVLPCQTSGRPLPDIYWLDVNGNIINDQNPRYKVQSNGELAIESLRWDDMGSYTCIAKNRFSKDMISTFLYPIADE